MARLIAEDLTVGWTDGDPVLKGVCLSLSVGVHCITGANGSGKTTLVRTMAGVIPPLGGLVRVDGRVGYLSHLPGIYSQLSVEDNLRQWSNFLDPSGQSPCQKLMDELALSEIGGQKGSTLSQGQRQRLGLARALLGQPDVVFLDEPTAGMDPAMKRLTHNVVRRLGERACVVVTSHDLLEVSGLATTVIQISGSAEVSQKEVSAVAALDDRRIRLSVDNSKTEKALQLLVEGNPQRESSGWIAVDVTPSFGISRVVELLSSEGIDIRAIDDLQGLETYYRG
ncbi:ABC transporter ATP-binding protein [Corynebacterium sp. LK2590]|uniref:ABC transporter ATP-binding protein n=1 Tax=unclassified Corynebacterium TaxID=2624378 RepID=UPI0034CFF8C9